MTQSFADPGASGQSSTRTANVDLTANVSGYTSQLNDAAQSTGTLSRGVDELTQRMAGLNKWAGKKLFHFAAGDFTALAVASADAATFEKQLSTLAATAAITGTSLHGIKSGIESAFTKFPVARGDVVSLVEAITDLGVTGARDIGSLTQTFIKLGAATGEPMNQLAGGLIQLSRLMGSTDATQIGNFANSLLTVSKNAGVSASGVLSFAQSIGPIARQAGIGESAVIGISAAFTKAGADGFVATNTFNSLLSGITSSIATGSPELNKYANLIGKTSTELSKMNKADAIVAIFTAISKQGPQAIATLNNLGIEGIRAQAAIAAITQSGDLKSLIDQSVGAQGNQGNLTKGANAAFDNLASSLVNVRNQFTQIGTAIGTTFLGPMTAVGNVVAGVARHISTLVKPFSALIGTLGVVAGGAAGVGSLALTAAGAIGTYALFRGAKNSKVVSAFRAGTTLGTGREDFSEKAPLGRAAAGQMGTIESGGLMLGSGFRSFGTRMGLNPTGEASPWRDVGVVRNAFGAGPLAFARMWSKTTESLMRGEMGGTEGTKLPVMQRLNLWGKSLQGQPFLQAASNEMGPLAYQLGRTTQATAAAGVGLAGRVLQRGWQFAGPMVMGGLVGGATGLPGGGRLANAARASLPSGSIAAEYGGVKDAGANLKTAIKGVRDDVLPLRVGFSAVGAASKDLAIALARTSGTVLGAGVGQAVRGVGATVGMGVRAVGTVGGAAMRGLFSLPGMMAMLGGHALMSRFDEQSHAGDINKFLNPIQKYNDLLGTTTANLANFNAALVQGASSVSGGIPGTMKQTATVTETDIASAPKSPTNKTFGDILAHSSGKKSAEALAAVLSALPISDPKQLQAAKLDMLSVAKDPAMVRKALELYMRAGGPSATSGVGGKTDWGALGAAAVKTEGNNAGGLGSWIVNTVNADISKSKSGGRILGSLTSGVDSERLGDAQKYGAAYAQQNALRSYTVGLAPLVGAARGGSDRSVASGKALADALSQIAGGKADDYRSYILDHQHDSALNSKQGRQQEVVDAIRSTASGSRWLGRLQSVGGTLDVAEFKGVLKSLSTQGDGSDFNSELKGFGQLGRFSARSGVIQSAIGAQQGNPSAIYNATKAMEGVAEGGKKVNDGYSSALSRLTAFAARVGDATGALGQLISAATAEELQKQQYAQPYQSHTKTLLQSARTYKDVAVQFNTAKAAGEDTTAIGATLATVKANYADKLSAEQGYNEQVFRAAQQFHLQQVRSEEDYGHSKLLQQQSYQLQSEYSLHDYQLQVRRANEDHNRQLAEQADQAAQSIYDPYQRIQAKYTQSGSTVRQLLDEQNTALADQMKNLTKLQHEGLSKQAIQTLDLANPNNAQQSANMASSLATDPRDVTRINRDIAQRVSLTKGLTQNTDNLGFAQSQKDFATSLNRSATDFATATARAAKQESISLNEMAYQFGTQTRRAAKDLALSAQDITVSFDGVKAKAIAAVKTISDSAPAAAKIWQKAFAADNIIDALGISDINTLVTAGTAAGKALARGIKIGAGQIKLPGMLNTPGNAPVGTPATVSAPNTMGINPKGAVGYYGPGGSFHRYNGPISTSTLPQIVPPRHAAGGIATRAQYGMFGEAGPEALIPLNQQGQDFMAGLITKAMSQVVRASGGTSTSSTTVDSSTNFTGPVTVVAQDTRAFERDMKAKARLRKLTSPAKR